MLINYISTKILVRTCSLSQKLAFFCRQLPGSFLLLQDFLTAAEKIAQSHDLDDPCPRVEAQHLVGSVIFLCAEKQNLTRDPEEIDEYESLSHRIGDFIINSCRRDPAGQARCVAFRYTNLISCI